MRFDFEPDETKQNGVFKYLYNRFGNNIKNYIEIYGTNSQDSSLFAIVNDSYNGRYYSAENASLNFLLVFRKFSVKITHYAMRCLDNYCFSKEWNIYDCTKNANVNISNGKFTQCGTSNRCSGEQIQIYETKSNSLIRSLKYEQVGPRTNNIYRIEFKSMEIYGTLIFDSECLKTYPHSSRIRVSLILVAILA